MVRNCLITAVLTMVAGSSISAAPMLLVEMNHETSRYGGDGDPPIRDWEFGFTANTPIDGPQLFAWFDVYGIDDIGKTFPAPDEIVHGAEFALASASTNYFIYTAGAADHGSGRLSDMSPPPGPCFPGACAQLFVPDPTAYRVTAMERVIDDLFAVRPTGLTSWIVGGNQIIRFWGVPIPEPSAGCLLLVGLITSFLWRPVRRMPMCA